MRMSETLPKVLIELLLLGRQEKAKEVRAFGSYYGMLVYYPLKGNEESA